MLSGIPKPSAARSGYLDMRAQADVPSVRRSDTPPAAVIARQRSM
jgi:hypothetical protein